MTDTSIDDEELHALISLMSLKHAGPRRLRALLALTSAVEVVGALRQRQRPAAAEGPGNVAVSIRPAVWDGWFNEIRAKADGVDLDAHRSNGGHILHPSHAAWPFGNDPDPPILAFVRGSTPLLEQRPSVAIVGTRRCTSVGRFVADSIGRGLAEAGVAVVSGLALGVDAAAHRGALSVGGAAIGVVASGLDVVYPARNNELWETVAAEGLLLSEVPMGQRPTKWRFPARNRMIAALSDLVVVVESHAKGGALSTVDEANDRGISVVVVPGSTQSPASDGTNALLIDGAIPVRDATDVLDVLGVTLPSGSTGPAAGASHTQLEIPLAVATGDSDASAVILDAVAAGPVHIDRLIEVLGMAPPAVAVVINELVATGAVAMQGHVVGPSESFR